MKHFYLTIVSALAVFATASAATLPTHKMVRAERAAESGEWKALGKGMFTDGWVTPGINGSWDPTDPASYAFEVDVMESTATPGMYKIVSPYTSEAFPFLSKNANTTPCDIIVDATNPDFVRVEPQNSGFVNVTLTSNYTDPFFICNAGSYYSLEGNSEADITAFGYASTLKDGVITFVGPKFGKSASYNDQGYQWQGEFNGRLVLPAGDSEWKLLGKGMFTDGWVTPGINGSWDPTDPARYAFEVDVMESTVTPGMYKIVSPYTSEAFPFLSKNANTTPCDIIVDATNPDFVRVEPQNSGFVNVTLTSNYTDPFFICNAGSYFSLEGNSEADITAFGYASTLKDGVITFVGPKFGKSANYNDQGYEWGGGFNGRLVLPVGGGDDETWTDAGEALFIDGFIFPGWYGNPENHGWKVALEEKDGQPGMYRLVNPYTTAGNPMLSANEFSGDAYLVIDATDPEVVVIKPQFCGFNGIKGGTQGGTADYYVGNIAGDLTTNDIWTKDEIKQYLPQRCDKLADKVITIATPMFGFNATNDFGYQWTDDNDKPMEFAAKICLPGYSGITDIEAEAGNDAPAEYFNMQGMRVANPAPGAVYIRRTGNKTEKIYIK